jgi:hypothetical protein
MDAKKPAGLPIKANQPVFNKAQQPKNFGLFAGLAVGGELVNSLLLHLALGDAGLLEKGATTQLFQNAGALEFLFETLQSAVNRFVVFDLNDNHIRE